MITEPTNTEGDMTQLQLSGKTSERGVYSWGKKLQCRTSQDFKNKMQGYHQKQWTISDWVATDCGSVNILGLAAVRFELLVLITLCQVCWHCLWMKPTEFQIWSLPCKENMTHKSVIVVLLWPRQRQERWATLRIHLLSYPCPTTTHVHTQIWIQGCR